MNSKNLHGASVILALLSLTAQTHAEIFQCGPLKIQVRDIFSMGSYGARILEPKASSFHMVAIDCDKLPSTPEDFCFEKIFDTNEELALVYSPRFDILRMFWNKEANPNFCVHSKKP